MFLCPKCLSGGRVVIAKISLDKPYIYIVYCPIHYTFKYVGDIESIKLENIKKSTWANFRGSAKTLINLSKLNWLIRFSNAMQHISKPLMKAP